MELAWERDGRRERDREIPGKRECACVCERERKRERERECVCM